MAMSIDIQTYRAVRSLVGVLAVFAALLTLPLAAQAPPVKEVVDVRGTNIEIIATDAKGNHVPGLTPDDFELYENGKLQPITNLFEATSATPDATAVPRRLVVYFDDSTILPNNRKQLIPALKKFVADVMTPKDQVMIVTFNQSSKVRLPWTNDVAAVQSMIDAIGREAGGGSLRQAARNRIENDIQNVVRSDQSQTLSGGDRTLAGTLPDADFRVLLSNVRNYASSVNHDFGVSAAALESLLGSLADVDGRKVVFIASESFTTRPGGEVFAYLESVRNAVLQSGSEGLKRGARSTNVTGAASEFNTNEAVLALGRIAHASGVTIYALDPDTGGHSDSGNMQQSGSDLRQGGTDGISGVDGLQILAQQTGGLAWIGMKPALAMEKLRADLDHYYSIGYRATDGNARRAIEVKSKRAGVRVRTLQGVAIQEAEAKLPAPATSTPAPVTATVQTAESEMSDQVTSNLQAAQQNELGISAQVAGEVVTDGDKRRVPVHVLIPASRITVVPEGDVFTGGFSVYVCTAGGAAEPSAVNEQSHEIRWTPAIIEQLDDRKMTFAIEVVLEKGRDLISVGVLDHRSQAKGFSKIEL
jgi:VWFA-related protein